MDIRQPSYYFEDRLNRRNQVNAIKVHLDDLIMHLKALKQQPGTTPAYQKVVENELKRVTKKKSDIRRKKAVKVIVNKIIDDNTRDAVELMMDELAYRVHTRIKPNCQKSGHEMQEDIFGD